MNLGFNGKSARALFARLPARHVTKHVLTSTSRTSFQTYSVFASFNSYISMTCSFSHFRHSYFCLIFINIRKISENSSVLVRDDRISAFGWMCTWDDAPGMMHRGWCTGDDAPGMMHRGWCTGVDAPGVMHRGWCTGGDAPGIFTFGNPKP